MLPNREQPEPITRTDLGDILEIDVVFRAKGFKREDGPTRTGLERKRQRELEVKEQN